MQPNSTLIYGEIVAIGRVANNERFEFRQFSSHLKVQLLQNNGQTKPLVLDCIQWQPAQMKLTALSQMEGFSHQGSLVYLNLQKTSTEVKQIVQTLQQQESEKSILIGVSQLNEGGLIVRVLGHRAELIQKLFEKIGEQLKSA